jgi:hypothetical protein
MNKLLGEILISHNLLSEEDLEQGLKTQVVYTGRIGTVLVQLGLVPLDTVGRCLSIQHGVPHASAELLDKATPEALERVPKQMAARYQIVPFKIHEGTLHLAMTAPLRQIAGELSFQLGLPIKRFVAPELRIMFYLEQLYDVPRDPRFLRLPNGMRKRNERRRYISTTVETVDPDAQARRDEPLGLTRLTSPEHSPKEVVPPPPPDPNQPVEAFRMVDVLAEKLANVDTGGGVAQILVEPCVVNMGSSVLFWMRERFAVACCAHGANLASRQLNQLVVQLDQSELLRQGHDKRAVVRGRAKHHPLHAKIAAFLGVPPPEEVCVVPVVLRGKVINLLCVNSLPGMAFDEGVQQELLVLAEKASAAYLRLTR